MLIKRGDGKIATIIEPNELLDDQTDQLIKENEKNNKKNKQAGNNKPS